MKETQNDLHDDIIKGLKIVQTRQMTGCSRYIAKRYLVDNEWDLDKTVEEINTILHD